MGSMVTVRLRRKDAISLLAEEDQAASRGVSMEWLRSALRAALRPKVRKPRPIRQHPCGSANQSKREETRAIWEACWKRCGGQCECLCGGDVRRAEEDSPFNHWPHIATMDHFRGRARVRQAVENCWILRADCHREKTNERPDKATWLRRFIVHAERHGYGFWAEEARKVLEGSVAVKADEKRRRSGLQSSSPVE